MSPRFRIVVDTVPQGSWSIFPGAFEAAGVEVLVAPTDIGELSFSDGWYPDALVTFPADYQQERFDRLDLDRWVLAGEAELTARFRLAQAVSRRMQEGNGGCVVHFVEHVGMPGGPGAGGAMTASYATAGLSRGMALDLRGRVRSNVVAVSPNQTSAATAVALVTHMVSAAGREISGQVVAIEAGRLQLFAQSRPVRVGHSDSPWTEAKLAQQVCDWADELPRMSSGAQA